MMGGTWMEELADSIAAKDKQASFEIAQREHCEGVIAALGPSFFRSFAECFKVAVDQMGQILDGRAITSPQTCTLRADGREVSFRRDKLPHISMEAKFMQGSAMLSIQFAVLNPEIPHGQNVVAFNPMQCRFESDGQERLYLVLDGQDFYKPKEAAEFLVKRLFTI